MKAILSVVAVGLLSTCGVAEAGDCAAPVQVVQAQAVTVYPTQSLLFVVPSAPTAVVTQQLVVTQHVVQPVVQKVVQQQVVQKQVIQKVQQQKVQQVVQPNKQRVRSLKIERVRVR